MDNAERMRGGCPADRSSGLVVLEDRAVFEGDRADARIAAAIGEGTRAKSDAAHFANAPHTIRHPGGPCA
jgi:hypothetical protein